MFEQEVIGDVFFKEVVLKNFVIKGYYIYKVKFLMINFVICFMVEREFFNFCDFSVCLVWILFLLDMFIDLYDMYIDFKRYLKVFDVVGLLIGYVFQGFSGIFCFFMEKGCVILSEFIRILCFSFFLWFQVYEKGGGVVIFCDYFIKCLLCMV